ncbi:hypothetical protein KA005_60130, partial [bacterium]|nr:hypothetical protein [bacterium]
MRKRTLIVICLIIGICIPCLVLILDDFFRSEQEDPFRVAKAFSYSYMTKDTEHMKSWAHKKAYEKIDDLQYSTSVDDRSSGWDNFELVCLRKLGNTIVSTYAHSPYQEPSFLYTAVLEPVGSHSLWERIKDFIYSDIPLGSKIVKFPYYKQRWLVVDFFTKDEDGYEKHINEFADMVKNKEWNSLLSKLQVDVDLMLDDISKRQLYEEKWSETEKIRQNEEMKILYWNYKGLQNNNAEGNLPA